MEASRAQLAVRLGAPVFVATAVALVSCLEPTQIAIAFFTDVPCDRVRGLGIAVGEPGRLESASFSATTASCERGVLGTLTVVPSSARDGRVGIFAVLGVGASPDECVHSSRAGCIYARRNLSFLEHQGLKLRVVLRDQCTDERCTPESTCRTRGECVSAEVEPAQCLSSNGCSIEEPGGPGSGGDGGKGDAASGSDASGADGSSEGGGSDGGGSDGGIGDDGGIGNDGGVGGRGIVTCIPSGAPPLECTGTRACCVTNMSTYSCVDSRVPCLVGDVRYNCDGPEDCRVGEACQVTSGSSHCTDTLSPTDSILCHVDADCGGTQRCRVVLSYGYMGCL